MEIKEFSSSNTKKNNEDKIYSNRATELDIIENGDDLSDDQKKIYFHQIYNFHHDL